MYQEIVLWELDDDAVTVIMMDMNTQRKDIQPSVKVRAYKMKYEAIKHQGSRGETLV